MARISVSMPGSHPKSGLPWIIRGSCFQRLIALPPGKRVGESDEDSDCENAVARRLYIHRFSPNRFFHVRGIGTAALSAFDRLIRKDLRWDGPLVTINGERNHE